MEFFFNFKVWKKNFFLALLILLQSAAVNIFNPFASGFKWRLSFAYDILFADLLNVCACFRITVNIIYMNQKNTK